MASRPLLYSALCITLLALILVPKNGNVNEPALHDNQAATAHADVSFASENGSDGDNAAMIRNEATTATSKITSNDIMSRDIVSPENGADIVVAATDCVQRLLKAQEELESASSALSSAVSDYDEKVPLLFEAEQSAFNDVRNATALLNVVNGTLSQHNTALLLDTMARQTCAGKLEELIIACTRASPAPPPDCPSAIQKSQQDLVDADKQVWMDETLISGDKKDLKSAQTVLDARIVEYNETVQRYNEETTLLENKVDQANATTILAQARFEKVLKECGGGDAGEG